MKSNLCPENRVRYRIAVAGATRCKFCQLFHQEAARLNGATDDEIAEASMMAGTTMLGSTFINAQGIDFEQFRRETLEIVNYVKSQQTQKTQKSRRVEGEVRR